MKKSKVLGLFILGLFLVSFLFGVVSAADGTQIMDSFKNLIFGNWSGFEGLISKILSPSILFGLLIFLVVFAIIDNLPLFGGKGESNWVKIGVSIILAILSAGFIDTNWIAPILNQYTAIGITISFLLPFVLLFYFLKETVPTSFLLQKIIWITYTVVVGFNAILNWSNVQSGWPATLYFLTILAALFMAIWGGIVFRKLFTSGLKSDLAKWSRLNSGKRAVKSAKLIEDADYFDEIGEHDKATDFRKAAEQLRNVKDTTS